MKNRWKGRTETNKLVFVETELDLRGQVRPVEIQWAGPWSLIGSLPGVAIPLELVTSQNNIG